LSLSLIDYDFHTLNIVEPPNTHRGDDHRGTDINFCGLHGGHSAAQYTEKPTDYIEIGSKIQ